MKLSTILLVLPGSSREWAGLGVFAAYVVVVPIGLLTLGAGRGLKSGPPTLRRLCVIVSILALVTPVVADLVWRYR